MIAAATATAGSPQYQAYTGARAMLISVDKDEKRKIAATSSHVRPTPSPTGATAPSSS